MLLCVARKDRVDWSLRKEILNEISLRFDTPVGISEGYSFLLWGFIL